MRLQLESWSTGLSEEERAAVAEVVRARTHARLFVMAVLLVVMHAAHTIVFLLSRTSKGVTWRHEVLALHVVWGVFAGLLAALLRFASPARTRRMPEVLAALYLVLGACLAAVDQQVTTAITPYMVVSMGIALLVRLPVQTVLVSQASGMTLFMIGQTVMQPDAAVRLSNQVNGLTVAGVAATLGVVLSTNEHRDVHQRRLIEHLAEEAQAASRAKSAFLASIGHELRTPMNAILGLVGLTRAETQDERHRAWLTTIERSGRGLLALLEDVLTTSRLESGRVELHPAPADPRAIVEEVAAAFEAELRAKKLQLEVSIDADVPTLVLDEVRLRQILFNLLNNAVKFTDRGSIVVAVSSERAGSNATLRIVVRDTGIGIPVGERTRIFEPFTQGSRAKDRPGAGLGLSITHRLVELMNGSIELLEAEVGTAFRVTLPGLPVTAPGHASTTLAVERPPESGEVEEGIEANVVIAVGVRGELAAHRRACGSQLRSDLLAPFAVALGASDAPALSALGRRLSDAVARFDVDAMKKAVADYDRLAERFGS